MERKFGITEFIRNSQQFDGILKHRYSDFHVFEIDLQGNQVHLNRENNTGNRLKFCHFTLFKQDKNTLDCVNYMARVLKIPPKRFGMAGIKDKRGITCQRISVDVAVERLLGMNKILKGVVIGDFKYSDQQLQLGDLRGNRFRIVLRRVQGATREQMAESLGNCKQFGFINYYGLQRFGTRALSTDAPGVCMLAEKWQDAIELILGDRVEDTGDYKTARDHWKEHKDPKAAFDLFPKSCIAERAILKSYIRDGSTNEPLKAIQAVV